jgi:hypothetical protein
MQRQDKKEENNFILFYFLFFLFYGFHLMITHLAFAFEY